MPTPSLNRVTSRSTVADQIYDQLRRALMWGQYEPGQSLTINSLAQELGTSHMPVREALHRIAAENGLEVARTGTAKVPPISRDRLDDICRARIELEGLATEIATTHVTNIDITHLKELATAHSEAAVSGQVYEMLHWNHAFHFALYELSRSSILPRLISLLWLQMGPYMRVLTHSIENDRAHPPTKLKNQHDLVIDALRRKDAAAARKQIMTDIRVTQRMLQRLCPAPVLAQQG